MHCALVMTFDGDVGSVCRLAMNIIFLTKGQYFHTLM